MNIMVFVILVILVMFQMLAWADLSVDFDRHIETRKDLFKFIPGFYLIYCVYSYIKYMYDNIKDL